MHSVREAAAKMFLKCGKVIKNCLGFLLPVAPLRISFDFLSWLVLSLRQGHRLGEGQDLDCFCCCGSVRLELQHCTCVKQPIDYEILFPSTLAGQTGTYFFWH